MNSGPEMIEKIAELMSEEISSGMPEPQSLCEIEQRMRQMAQVGWGKSPQQTDGSPRCCATAGAGEAVSVWMETALSFSVTGNGSEYIWVGKYRRRYSLCEYGGVAAGARAQTRQASGMPLWVCGWGDDAP